MSYTLITVVIILLLVGVGGYYVYTTLQTRRQSPSVVVTPGAQGDVVTISDNGVSSSSTTETYIAAPRLEHCSNELRGGNPSAHDWCDSDMSSSAEMNYAYDPASGTMSANGGFTTTFDGNTGKCSDGTKSCIFEENYDSERKLIDITNEDGESLINKFSDDLWSGRIVFTDAAKENFNKNITFENNKLYIKDWVCTTGEGGEENCDEVLGAEITPKNTPPGLIVLMTLFWYKANDKPRPTIKFDIKSEKTLGQMVIDARSGGHAGFLRRSQAPDSRPPIERAQ